MVSIEFFAVDLDFRAQKLQVVLKKKSNGASRSTVGLVNIVTALSECL